MTVQTPLQPDSSPPGASVVRPLDYRGPGGYRRPSLFANWFWFILKNVLGWILILTAMLMGPLVPGPGGLPLFLIGFGLITFPGKRRITARVLSGAPVSPQSRAYRRGVAGIAIFAPALTLAYLLYKFPWLHNGTRRLTAMYLGLYVVAAIIVRVAGMRAVGLINWGMRMVPK